MTGPLLSIVIPTYNRAPFLAKTLAYLNADLQFIETGVVEIIVSNNASTDHTHHVIEAAVAEGLNIRSITNDHNIGSDANIAQSFNLASGQYVLILGDDDVLADGTLRGIVETISSNTYGVICLKPYGYDDDLEAERPKGSAKDIVFYNPGDFLATIGAYVTLISSCVINKASLHPIDAQAFCGGNLVQVHLVIQAALHAGANLYRQQYSVACKRNNSGGYDFARVFVQELGAIFDQYQCDKLTPQNLSAFENRMILGFHPYYLLRQRRNASGNLHTTYEYFLARFRRKILFWIWLMPIIKMPRRISLIWGSLAVLFGRSLTGDFQRGIKFFHSALMRRLRLG